MWKLPENTDYMKEQNNHIPTREYAQEIYNIVSSHAKDYKVALEIGCAWGVSALAILEAGDGYLTSVDSNGRNHALIEIPIAGYASRWTFENQPSTNYWKNNEQEFDIVYIDGSHKYPQCYEDLIEGWKVLKKGGIMIADDYTHPKNMSVDTDGSVEYGVSFSVCRFLYECNVKRIQSGKHTVVFFK